MIDTLPGAVGNNVAASINNLGDVVGTQAISDGTIHGFLWNKTTGIVDVMMPGMFVTVVPCCHSINERRQITGFAIDGDGTHGFVWQDGNFYQVSIRCLRPIRRGTSSTPRRSTAQVRLRLRA